MDLEERKAGQGEPEQARRSKLTANKHPDIFHFIAFGITRQADGPVLHRPVHQIAHRLPEQGAAAVFAAFDAHIHDAFFAVECGVRIEDEAVVGGVRGVAPGLQERVFGGWRFGFQYVDPGPAIYQTRRTP